MKYLALIFLIFSGISKAGEQKSIYLAKDIIIEFDGEKKTGSYYSEIIIRDDIAEDDYRHFYIYLPYQGEVKDVELEIIREGSPGLKLRLKDADKFVYNADYILASDHYYYHWDLGSLKPGDLIKRRYKLELKNASYGDYEPILNSIPVKKATVTIRYPGDDWSLSYCVDNGDIALEENNSEMSFIWEDLPGLKDSDFEEAPKDMLPGISYLFKSKKGERDFSEWSSIYDWHHDLCEGTSLTEDDLDLLDIADTPEEIFSKIIDECRYVAVEIEKGRYKPTPASKVWAQRYGDCKALSNLFVNWLKLAGYEAWPVLMRSRNSYLGNSDFPSPYEFDHEIAAFVTEKGDTVYQDLTAESLPFGYLPISHYGDFALPLIENTMPIRLSYSPREPDTIRYSISGVIDELFNLSGRIVCRRTGQTAMEEIWKAKNMRKGAGRKSDIKTDFESMMKGAVFDNIEERFQGDTVIIRTAGIRKRNMGFLKDNLVILKPWIMDYFNYDNKPDSNRTWPTILRRNIVYITEYGCKLGCAVSGDIMDNGLASFSEGFEFSFVNESQDDSLKIKAVMYMPPQIFEPDDYLSYTAKRSLLSEMLDKGLYYERKR